MSEHAKALDPEAWAAAQVEEIAHNCSHTQEPGCAVLTAIANGELREARYSSYSKLKKESEYHEMSYEDKRKKDRAFGRFIKSAKKQMNQDERAAAEP